MHRIGFIVSAIQVLIGKKLLSIFELKNLVYFVEVVLELKSLLFSFFQDRLFKLFTVSSFSSQSKYF
jgi:hypothetical protein